MICQKNENLLRRRVPARGALTIVELVATTTALVLLTVMLVPAAASVGRSSKFSRCLSNLKQIGYANLVYAAQDLSNAAIPVHPTFVTNKELQFEEPYAWGGKSGVGQAKRADALWTSKWGTRATLGPARRPLNRIIYGDTIEDYTEDPGDDYENWMTDAEQDLDVYACPSDAGYSGIHSPAFRDERRTSFDHYGTSYGANTFLISSSGGVASNSPFFRPLSDVISPATTLAYQENNGRFAWAARPDPCDFLIGIPGIVRGWHGKDWTFNAAFLDGHAAPIHMERYRSDILEVLPHGANWSMYRCIIIRGIDWQKDTLPAPLVETHPDFRPQQRASYEDGIE